MKEIYREQIAATYVKVANSQIDAIRRKNIVKTGYRIIENGLIGVSGAIGSFNENELEARARQMLEFGLEYPWELSGNHSQIMTLQSDIPSEDVFVGEVELILTELRNKYPNFILSQQMGLFQTDISLKNDKGLELVQHDSGVSVGLRFKHRDSSGIMDGFVSYSSRIYQRDKIIEELGKTLEAFEIAAEFPEGDVLPIVFPSYYGCLHKFATDLNGNIVGSGSSILGSKMGTRAFNPAFTMLQSTHPEDGFHPFFDMEGCINENYRIPLVDKGVVNYAYTDKKTAAKYGLRHTGSADSGYDTIPAVGQPTLVIEPSEKSLVELLDGKPGIAVIVSSGGDFTPDGHYAAPVQLAFLTDGRRFLGKLPEFSVKSDLFTMFGDNYVGVSRDKVYEDGFQHYLVTNMQVLR